jgi:hypothetical protein
VRRVRARAPAAAVAAALLCSIVSRPGSAQITVSNLVEAQAGNRPFASLLGEPSNPTSVFDELNAELALSGLRLGFRFESLDDSRQINAYDRFSQRYADWKADGLRVRVGDFYTILGRGLTLRAFELPGVVLQDPGTGSRTSFSRELDGVLIEGEWGPATGRAFSAHDLSSTQSGAQAALGPWRGATVGASYARLSSGGGTNTQELGSGFAEWDPFVILGDDRLTLPIYAEYAQANRSASQWWELRTGDRVPHALYVSSEVVWGSLTLSAEWKDYRDFRLGVNDPPSLVREHYFPLPNRSTHVLDATSEHGIQLEGAWSVFDWGSFTANHSRADGTPSGRELHFEETYFETHFAASRWPSLEGSVFLDRGRDTFVQIVGREIYGTSATGRFLGRWSCTLDLERLDAERGSFLGPNVGFTDHYVSAQVARAGWGSLAWIWQRTTNPDEEDPNLFGGPVEPRVYRAWNASALIGSSHTIQLFVGERRGGPACTAGTCYEVAPFEGAELRLASRF